MDHSYLRREAKAAVKANWVMLACGTLFYLFLNGVSELIPFAVLIVAGPLQYGYIKFVTRQVDENRLDFNDMFAGFSRFADTFAAGLICSLVVALGTFLLIVPGIIAACGLSQVFFIMNDDPTVSGTDAIRQSWDMMKGHKMDYFVFILGFIGWLLLCIITFGLLILYVEPYMVAAQLNYYRSLRNYPPEFKTAY